MLTPRAVTSRSEIVRAARGRGPVGPKIVFVDVQGMDLEQHDCGVYYVVGQPHICPDVVVLPHERNRALQSSTT